MIPVNSDKFLRVRKPDLNCEIVGKSVTEHVGYTFALETVHTASEHTSLLAEERARSQVIDAESTD